MEIAVNTATEKLVACLHEFSHYLFCSFQTRSRLFLRKAQAQAIPFAFNLFFEVIGYFVCVSVAIADGGCSSLADLHFFAGKCCDNHLELSPQRTVCSIRNLSVASWLCRLACLQQGHPGALTNCDP
jgi:hypothetical protein